VLVRREPEKFRPAQRRRAPLLSAAGLAVIAILIRGSGWQTWVFTAATTLLAVLFHTGSIAKRGNPRPERA